MNQRLAALKELSIQYSIPLVKNQLSDELVEAIMAEKREHPGADVLLKPIARKEDLQALKTFVEQAKPFLAQNLYWQCKEELAEIREDLQWRNSKAGKQVLALEDWVQLARIQLAEQGQYTTVFIGRSFVDPLAVVVSGMLPNEAEVSQLKTRIALLHPPVEPKYVIETSATPNAE